MPLGDSTTDDPSVSPNSIAVTLPDGSTRQLPVGATVADLAAAIGPRLADAAIAGFVNGVERDLTATLPDSSSVMHKAPKPNSKCYRVIRSISPMSRA